MGSRADWAAVPGGGQTHHCQEGFHRTGAGARARHAHVGRGWRYVEDEGNVLCLYLYLVVVSVDLLLILQHLMNFICKNNQISGQMGRVIKPTFLTRG